MAKWIGPRVWEGQRIVPGKDIIAERATVDSRDYSPSYSHGRMDWSVCKTLVEWMAWSCGGCFLFVKL